MVISSLISIQSGLKKVIFAFVHPSYKIIVIDEIFGNKVCVSFSTIKGSKSI